MKKTKKSKGWISLHFCHFSAELEGSIFLIASSSCIADELVLFGYSIRLGARTFWHSTLCISRWPSSIVWLTLIFPLDPLASYRLLNIFLNKLYPRIHSFSRGMASVPLSAWYPVESPSTLRHSLAKPRKGDLEKLFLNNRRYFTIRSRPHSIFYPTENHSSWRGVPIMRGQN